MAEILLLSLVDLPCRHCSAPVPDVPDVRLDPDVPGDWLPYIFNACKVEIADNFSCSPHLRRRYSLADQMSEYWGARCGSHKSSLAAIEADRLLLLLADALDRLGRPAAMFSEEDDHGRDDDQPMYLLSRDPDGSARVERDDLDNFEPAGFANAHAIDDRGEPFREPIGW